MTTLAALTLLALSALRLRLSWVRWWAERAPTRDQFPTLLPKPTTTQEPVAAIVLDCERE